MNPLSAPVPLRGKSMGSGPAVTIWRRAWTIWDVNLARSLTLLTLVAVLSLAAGCAMLRLGYSHLDTFAASTADEYFDLDPVQRHEFVSRFDRLHEWHRREQLPEYAAFLKETNGRLQKGLTREDVVWFMKGLDERYRTIVRRGADDAVTLLVTITPEQVNALQRKWEKDNRKFIREHRLDGSPDDQRAARAKRTLSQIRDWTGALTDEQEQRIIAMSNKPPSIERVRNEERLRRQREFLKIMELRGNREDFAKRLRHWLLNWEEGRTPEQARLFKEAEDKRVDLYLATVQMLAPNQRTHLAYRVQGFIGDFTRLAER